LAEFDEKKVCQQTFTFFPALCLTLKNLLLFIGAVEMLKIPVIHGRSGPIENDTIFCPDGKANLRK
jgi:hypothetical protein